MAKSLQQGSTFPLNMPPEGTQPARTVGATITLPSFEWLWKGRRGGTQGAASALMSAAVLPETPSVLHYIPKGDSEIGSRGPLSTSLLLGRSVDTLK
jgi:hypothetical protein